MITDRRKLAFAALVSAVLLGLLLYAGKFRFPDLSQADPAWLAAVGAAHLVVVAGRGLSFRALAPEGNRGARRAWLQLAARHQILFSLVPGGLGDTGFPFLAKRIVGLDAPVAVRVIAQFRLRDAILLAAVTIAALVLIGVRGPYGLIGLAIVLPLLWVSDDIAVGLLKVARHLLPGSRIVGFLREASDHETPTLHDRTVRTALAILVWSASTAAVLAAFRAIGVTIGVGEALLFIAAVNVAGALSISIAGLGVSEAGAAAALVVMGRSVQRATSLALVVRPLLLLSVLAMSLAIGLATGPLRSPPSRAASRL
jgi:uncharacterized membrane protein YbhN (UPF0104 family)